MRDKGSTLIADKRPVSRSGSLGLGFLWLCLAMPTATAARTTLDSGFRLDHLVLRSSQVGQRYVLKQIPGGRRVRGEVTLDMCGYNFKSERRRVARLQVGYVRKDSSLTLSNEVVRYQERGATQAMGEIAEAIRTCPKRPVRSNIAGVPPLTYDIHYRQAPGVRYYLEQLQSGLRSLESIGARDLLRPTSLSTNASAMSSLPSMRMVDRSRSESLSP
jgi:hypothetical protein